MISFDCDRTCCGLMNEQCSVLCAKALLARMRIKYMLIFATLTSVWFWEDAQFWNPRTDPNSQHHSKYYRRVTKFVSSNPITNRSIEVNEMVASLVRSSYSHPFALNIKHVYVYTVDPGLIPGFEYLRNGDITRNRTTMLKILNGC